MDTKATSLNERLKELRKDKGLTQVELARVLSSEGSVRDPTISSWEKDKLPTPERLDAYARLFCTDRSFESGDPRLLRNGELTEKEKQKTSDLYAELIALRDKAQSINLAAPAAEESDSIWSYPDGAPIRIACSVAPKADRPSYADPGHLNYTSFARFADLDTLIAVHGQIKADNPKSDVKVMSLQDFKAEDTRGHVVIIGGGAADHQAGRLLCRKLLLPEPERVLYRTGAKTWDSHIFRFGESDRFKASFDEEGLIGDIGVFARGPHPSVQDLTVTVCNGITSRGVLGAALCFIDSERKIKNQQYIRDRLDNVQAYCICMEVEVLGGDAAPPDLSAPEKVWWYTQP